MLSGFKRSDLPNGLDFGVLSTAVSNVLGFGIMLILFGWLPESAFALMFTTILGVRAE